MDINIDDKILHTVHKCMHFICCHLYVCVYGFNLHTCMMYSTVHCCMDNLICSHICNYAVMHARILEFIGLHYGILSGYVVCVYGRVKCMYVCSYVCTPTDKTRVVSTRRRIPTNWVSGRTLQPSIESVVANSFVPSDFLVDGQVSGLGTVHPLLTLSFVSTWILPLHVVSSTLKRKSSSSVMDGLQRRRKKKNNCDQTYM